MSWKQELRRDKGGGERQRQREKTLKIPFATVTNSSVFHRLCLLVLVTTSRFC